MKWGRLMGLFLVIFGVVVLIYDGISYTSRQRTFQIGRLEATAKAQRVIPLSLVPGWGGPGGRDCIGCHRG
jgi:predicted CxxxxCH...CXXCH cytochrome family protein